MIRYPGRYQKPGTERSDPNIDSDVHVASEGFLMTYGVQNYGTETNEFAYFEPMQPAKQSGFTSPYSR
jgi:hypothetical protein